MGARGSQVAGASIPWGNEAEIFIIAISEGQEEISST